MSEHVAMTLLDAINHWYRLADSEEGMARHFEGLGLPYGSVDSYYVRARVYRETARAMRLESETGEVYCSCHLRPRSEWRALDGHHS